jgi:hypothetical protein
MNSGFFNLEPVTNSKGTVDDHDIRPITMRAFPADESDGQNLSRTCVVCSASTAKTFDAAGMCDGQLMNGRLRVTLHSLANRGLRRRNRDAPDQASREVTDKATSQSIQRRNPNRLQLGLEFRSPV